MVTSIKVSRSSNPVVVCAWLILVVPSVVVILYFVEDFVLSFSVVISSLSVMSV